MKKGILTLLVAIVFIGANAQKARSVTSGDWSNPNTWDCSCVPNSTIDVNIRNGHSITLSANSNCNTLNIYSGSLNNSTFTLNVDGDYNNWGTHSGSGDIILDGAANKYIKGTGTITNTGNFTIQNGQATFRNTAVITKTSGTILLDGSDQMVVNRGVVTAVDLNGTQTSSKWTNQASSTLNVSGSVMATGKLRADYADNTVNYNGTGNQDIKAPSNAGYYEFLVCGGSGTKSLTGYTVVRDNLDITSTFDPGNSGHLLKLHGNLNCSGTYGTGDHELRLQGTSNQDISVSSGMLNDVRLNGFGFTLQTPVTMNGDLNMQSGVMNTTSSNVLVMLSSSTTTGGSDASHVNGPLQREGTPQRKFTIGKGGQYRPVILMGISGSGLRIQMEVFNGATGGTAGNGLSSISDVRYYEAQLIAGSFTKLSPLWLSYGADDNVTSQTTLRIGYSPTLTGSYSSLGNEFTDGTVLDGRIRSNSAIDVTSMGFFVLGEGCSTGSPTAPIQITSYSYDAPQSITYTTSGDPASTFVWTVVGAVINSGQGTGEIEVSGNPSSVSVREVNSCGDTLTAVTEVRTLCLVPYDGKVNHKTSTKVWGILIPGIAPGIGQYIMQISADSDFVVGVTSVMDNLIKSNLGVDYPVHDYISGLNFSTTYYVRIREVSGSYGAVTSFTTQGPTGWVIVPFHGTVGVANDTLMVLCNEVIGASTYTIELNTTSDFSGPGITQSGGRWLEFTGLAPSTTYYTRTKTDLSDPAWGSVTNFTTAAPRFGGGGDFSQMPEPMVFIADIEKILKVYPNPASQRFNISSEFISDENTTTLRIIDAKGMVVQENLDMKSTEVDISDMETGFYLIHVQMGEDIYSTKLIKE